MASPSPSRYSHQPPSPAKTNPSPTAYGVTTSPARPLVIPKASQSTNTATTDAEGLVSLSTHGPYHKNLPTTADDQHTPGNGIYSIAAYHQLHCVSVLRAALYRYHDGATQTVEWMHMVPCVESLHQAPMCSADDMLLYTNGNGTVGASQTFGDGQLRVGRDLEALRTWTEGLRLEA